MARQDELYQKYYTEGKSRVDSLLGERRSQDAETLARLGEVIDQNAETAANPYRQQITEAPKQEWEQLDLNALDELVQRRQLQESMANAGLTDSGLNRTQQTALSVMRGNADAGVRKSTQEKVTKLQSAIDEILAKAAQQKTEQELSTRNATDSWYQQALQNLDTSARSSASTEYAAEQEAAAKIQAAQLEAAAKARAAALEAAKDNSAARGKYAQALITSGNMDEGDAWDSAYLRYPTWDAETDSNNQLRYAARQAGYTGDAATAYVNAGGGEAGRQAATNLIVSRAQNAVQSSGIKLNVAGWNTLWGNGNGNDGKVAGETVKKRLSGTGAYQSLSETEQQAALAIAIGRSVAMTWSGSGDKKKNETRLKKAVAAAGLSSDMYELAQEYYRNSYKH